MSQHDGDWGYMDIQLQQKKAYALKSCYPQNESFRDQECCEDVNQGRANYEYWYSWII